MYGIIVFGKASNKELINDQLSNIDVNLMEWLRSKKIPLASSCNGEGICKKCVINTDILACKVNLSDLVNAQNLIYIEISYL